MSSPISCVLLAMAACGGSAAPKGELAQPAADPAPCHEVAAHELTVMSVGFLPAAKTDAMRGSIEAHCRDDRWALDARRCIVTATRFDDMTACHDKLTPAQRIVYQRDLHGSDEPEGEIAPGSAQPELLK